MISPASVSLKYSPLISFSQQPTANSQQPVGAVPPCPPLTANSQQSTANSQQPTANSHLTVLPELI
ncbi:MAG: hypothetical protein WBA89_03235 [Microcoleus sp.]|uniref:hypothetical protein n=1 Tax=Microcoleus sp. TaxID=44472 RepID=UPI003C755390